jgi:putative nucleotidyltransferase with HDIG domain
VKDDYTADHTRGVALRSVQVGEELGLAPVRLRELAVGGLLHDVGKLAVPNEILRKPGALTDEEFDVIKRHPEAGAELVRELGFSKQVARLVLNHHERLDGTGYPRGTGAPDLDLETRILAVCDVFDALLSKRVYRDAWALDDALELIRSEVATKFDPACVAALERVIARDQRDAERAAA